MYFPPLTGYLRNVSLALSLYVGRQPMQSGIELLGAAERLSIEVVAVTTIGSKENIAIERCFLSKESRVG